MNGKENSEKNNIDSVEQRPEVVFKKSVLILFLTVNNSQNY